jgi:hypothetical protein
MRLGGRLSRPWRCVAEPKRTTLGRVRLVGRTGEPAAGQAAGRQMRRRVGTSGCATTAVASGSSARWRRPRGTSSWPACRGPAARRRRESRQQTSAPAARPVSRPRPSPPPSYPQPVDGAPAWIGGRDEDRRNHAGPRSRLHRHGCARRGRRPDSQRGDRIERAEFSHASAGPGSGSAGGGPSWVFCASVVCTRAARTVRHAPAPTGRADTGRTVRPAQTGQGVTSRHPPARHTRVC